jgi:DNA-binding CsgD family transcriptional regulator
VDGGRRRSRGTLFVIHDPLSLSPPVPQLVAEMFGLPLGSATILAALAAGVELKDYAERAGISMNTVRFHLKTAYSRTGVHRQSDLVRLVTAALRDIADHREKP